MKKYIIADVDITDLDDESVFTRISVAKDPSTRPSRLAELAKSPERIVRYCVFKNPNTPEDIKAEINQDYEFTEWHLAFDMYLQDASRTTDDHTDYVRHAIIGLLDSWGAEFLAADWIDSSGDNDGVAPEVDEVDQGGSYTVCIAFNCIDDDMTLDLIRGDLYDLLESLGYAIEYSEYY